MNLLFRSFKTTPLLVALAMFASAHTMKAQVLELSGAFDEVGGKVGALTLNRSGTFSAVNAAHRIAPIGGQSSHHHHLAIAASTALSLPTSSIVTAAGGGSSISTFGPTMPTLGSNDPSSFSPVPEPSTWVAGVLAVLAVGFSQRRRFLRSGRPH